MMIPLIIALEVVCVGVGAFQYGKLAPKSLRLVVLYLALALLIDVLLELIPDPTGVWTRGQYDLMFPIEFAVYVNLFRPKPMRFFWAMAIGLAGFGLYQLVVNLHVKQSSTTLFLVMCLLMLPIILLYFRSLLTSDKVLSLSQEPLFWIATSLLFFYSGNVIVTGFYFVLSDRNPEISRNLFYINYVLTAVRYGMFTVAFAVAGRNQDG